MEEVPHAARETVEAAEGVHLTQLAVGERMSVQHFHIEPGARVPEHDHRHEQ
ncbi:MAG: cupin domain-containing protein, partial [Haloarculaceae archaeon]